MPRSRKRHHSRSRSRSRSHSHDRSHEKHRKIDSHEKDGKRRKIEPYDSPQKRSVSSEQQVDNSNENIHLLEESSMKIVCSSAELIENKVPGELKPENTSHKSEEGDSPILDDDLDISVESKSSQSGSKDMASEKDCQEIKEDNVHISETDEDESLPENETQQNHIEEKHDTVVIESGDETLPSKKDITTPKKPLTPKQMSKRLESEKKRHQKLKEKEDREKKKQEEKDRLREEKIKQKQQKEAEKQKLLEQKQKEREAKEEQKRKEKEEKEQKRKEKEEKEEQKRKERELEKLKRQQEIDEKNLEKQREEEKKQKTAAAFVNFFVPKKSSENSPEERKIKPEKVQTYFMPFEIKSDMRLPPNRRNPLTDDDKRRLVKFIENQDIKASYLKELKSGALIRKTFKTWPYDKDQELDDEVTIIEEDSNLGQTISEDTVKTTKARAKFLHFHENRRPAYFGTWRKKSRNIKPRRPFAEDTELLNYEEDSDDDWEEEEQGESLEVSDDEKENEEEKDDYEVDNDFFVPHGHLSDDEIDDEENARLSPESLKQKLKLLKDEFEEDIKSKTHKLKPRSIGCVWYNKNGDNVDEAIHRYLLPFAMLTNGQIQIKKRSDIFTNMLNQTAKKVRPFHEMPADHLPVFLKIVHGNVNNKRAIAEEFLTYMANNGYPVDISKADILRNLRQMAEYKKFKENGRNKFCWFVNDDVREKYNIGVEVSPKKAE